MNKQLICIFSIFVLVCLAGCSKTETPAPSASNTVEIKNFAFNPAEIDINKGDTVSWVNLDSVPHAIAFDNGGGLADSENLGNGQNYSQSFDKEGTYAYHCKIHPSMKGKVVVK